MIREIHIENFKSIDRLTLELGRVNVLIGENGAGKSNVLEAIAFAAAASQNKLNNEYLAPRGIRVTEPRFMRAAFAESERLKEIKINATDDAKQTLRCRLKISRKKTSPDLWVDSEAPVPKAARDQSLAELQSLKGYMRALSDRNKEGKKARDISDDAKLALEKLETLERLFEEPPQQRLSYDFLIYAPENTVLRTFEVEGQILPLGSKGEGIFSHLRTLADRHPDRFAAVLDGLSLIDWFEKFEIPKDLTADERRLLLRDRYLAQGALFDQRSANEGFLLLLFYLTLFASPATPEFFAIDNIDASLNPKLCRELVQRLTALARRFKKQAILTTHNAALLDGLNLHDDEQRLLVVRRDEDGHTRAHRVPPPRVVEGQSPLPLSQAFMRGFLGGLPDNF